MKSWSTATGWRLAASLFAIATLRVSASDSAVTADANAAGGASASSKTIEYDGQTFTLANSARNDSVETDEYAVSGEKISNWTQLVTVQRLTLAKPTDTEAFVAFFKQRVGEDGASLDVLAHSKVANAFAVRFPKSEQNDEQVMICLAFLEPAKPAELNIVQFAIKPTRNSLDVTTNRIKRWRDKFIAQAESMRGK